MNPVIVLREICRERRPQTTVGEILDYLEEIGVDWTAQELDAVDRERARFFWGDPRENATPEQVAATLRDALALGVFAHAGPEATQFLAKRSSAVSLPVASPIGNGDSGLALLRDDRVYKASAVAYKLGMATSGNLTRLIAQGKLEGKKTKDGWYVTGKSLRAWLEKRRRPS